MCPGAQPFHRIRFENCSEMGVVATSEQVMAAANDCCTVCLEPNGACTVGWYSWKQASNGSKQFPGNGINVQAGLPYEIFALLTCGLFA